MTSRRREELDNPPVDLATEVRRGCELSLQVLRSRDVSEDHIQFLAMYGITAVGHLLPDSDELRVWSQDGLQQRMKDVAYIRRLQLEIGSSWMFGDSLIELSQRSQKSFRWEAIRLSDIGIRCVGDLEEGSGAMRILQEWRIRYMFIIVDAVRQVASQEVRLSAHLC
jgi:hypothetical protein